MSDAPAVRKTKKPRQARRNPSPQSSASKDAWMTTVDQVTAALVLAFETAKSQGLPITSTPDDILRQCLEFLPAARKVEKMMPPGMAFSDHPPGCFCRHKVLFAMFAQMSADSFEEYWRLTQNGMLALESMLKPREIN